MNRDEFDQLRRLPGKEIEADIVFVNVRELKEYIFVFDGARVLNSLGHDIVAGGQYNQKTGRITYHFTLRGVGQICRVDVNGAEHGDVGRTHKHGIVKDDDVRKKLPHPAARPDLEGKTPREVWDTLCQQAGISHTGQFTDPPGVGR